MIKSNNIELFKNLSQIEYENIYFDFHNDFSCVKIMLNVDNCLILLFTEINNNTLISFRFQDVMIRKMSFFNTYEINHLTIDNLYRGRTEKKGSLVEFMGDCGYYYLEFYEGQKLEFWSSGFEIEK